MVTTWSPHPHHFQPSRCRGQGWGGYQRVSARDIGRSGELWARVVELESPNTERTTGRATSVAHTHSKSPYSTTKAIHAIVAAKSSIGGTTGTTTEGQIV